MTGPRCWGVCGWMQTDRMLYLDQKPGGGSRVLLNARQFHGRVSEWRRDFTEESASGGGISRKSQRVKGVVGGGISCFLPSARGFYRGVSERSELLAKESASKASFWQRSQRAKRAFGEFKESAKNLSIQSRISPPTAMVAPGKNGGSGPIYGQPSASSDLKIGLCHVLPHGI
jgi:hypothetical protein